jgi:hypothetical protein
MTLIARRPWRENVLAVGLGQRLQAAGCPLSLREIRATESVRSISLVQWAKSSLEQGVMLRSAQSELLARGESLTEIARATGISVEQVLYYLTRFEWEFTDEAAVINFYNPIDEGQERE